MDLPEIETALNTKLHGTVISFLAEDMLERFPVIAGKFEKEVLSSFTVGAETFCEDYDNLLLKYLNMCGYGLTYERLMKSHLKVFIDEKNILDLAFHAEGRAAVRKVAHGRTLPQIN